MKRFICLTAIAHPDINDGRPRHIYVDPDHIVLIERNKHQQERWASIQEKHRLMVGLWDEVQRALGELSGSNVPNLMPANQQEEADIRRWLMRKDAAASLQAAYGLIIKEYEKPSFYDPVDATCIQLAVPNARFTMLPVCYVEETPEEVAQLIIEA